MEFDWHSAKRDWTLAQRGVDFAEVLIGFLDADRKVAIDDRMDYGKIRYRCSPASAAEFTMSHIPSAEPSPGLFPRGKANEREKRRYEKL